MLTLNIFIILLALATTIISSLNKSKVETAKAQKRKNISLIVIGILTMTFTVANVFMQKSKDDIDDAEKIKLHGDVNDIQGKLDSKIKSDSLFNNWLKDTFGITRQGDRPVINNTKIYNLRAQQPQAAGLPDSINYSIKLKNDILTIAPKEGTWAHGYFAFDTSNSSEFNKMLEDGMGTANHVDKIMINGRVFNTHLFKIYDRPVYKEEPISLNISSYANGYIIFGEQGIASKRYFYRQGKVSWIPK